MMKKTLSAITMAALMATASMAVAAEGNSGLYPTDVKGFLKGTAEVGYGWSFRENKVVTTVSDYAGTNSQNTINVGASLGLGYGLQVSVEESIVTGGGLTTSYPQTVDYTVNQNGAKNPIFGIRWSPTQVFTPNAPLQAVIGYKIKPRGIAGKRTYDDFTENTVSAYVSYDLPQYKLRPYVGYEFAAFGNAGAHFEDDRIGTDLGRSNTLIVGTEYKVCKPVNARIQYAYSHTGGVQYYTSSYGTHSAKLELEYKLPVKKINAYLVPWGELDIVNHRSYLNGGGEIATSTNGKAGIKMSLAF